MTRVGASFAASFRSIKQIYDTTANSVTVTIALAHFRMLAENQ
jgi:hypothetical protein